MPDESITSNGLAMPDRIKRNSMAEKPIVMSTLMLSLPVGNDELLVSLKKELEIKTKDVQGRTLRVILQSE